jgi:hypothetical protein
MLLKKKIQLLSLTFDPTPRKYNTPQKIWSEKRLEFTSILKKSINKKQLASVQY